jgi:diphosphomevalonate decarboxylase
MKAVARACANIALVKYWGKRDLALNLPAAGSISLTLDGLSTEAEVELFPGEGPDEVWIDGQPATEEAARRVSRFLDLVRERAGRRERARVATRSNFPIGAGLASSASAFAALALAASRAAGLRLGSDELSALARRGSGSAARSVHAGFVEMLAGSRADGADAVARPLAPPDHWDVRMVAAITAPGAKVLGSTEAMIHTARTSPLYPGWLSSVPPALEAARSAILARDLSRLGEVMEHSALAMHATAIAARPPIFYWNPVTVAALDRVRGLRREGTAAYFTIDAGPHVKALCEARDADRVAAALREVPGVLRTLVLGPGPAAIAREEAA